MTPSYQRTGFTLKQTSSIAFFFFHNGSFFGASLPLTSSYFLTLYLPLIE